MWKHQYSSIQYCAFITESKISISKLRKSTLHTEGGLNIFVFHRRTCFMVLVYLVTTMGECGRWFIWSLDNAGAGARNYHGSRGPTLPACWPMQSIDMDHWNLNSALIHTALFSVSSRERLSVIDNLRKLGWDLAIARYQPRPCGQQGGFAPTFFVCRFGFGHQGLPFGPQGLQSTLRSPRSSLRSPRSSLWSPRSLHSFSPTYFGMITNRLTWNNDQQH